MIASIKRLKYVCRHKVLKYWFFCSFVDKTWGRAETKWDLSTSFASEGGNTARVPCQNYGKRLPQCLSRRRGRPRANSWSCHLHRLHIWLLGCLSYFTIWQRCRFQVLATLLWVNTEARRFHDHMAASSSMLAVQLNVNIKRTPHFNAVTLGPTAKKSCFSFAPIGTKLGI